MFYYRKSAIDSVIGQQHPDLIELEDQLKLNKKTNLYLEKKIKKYKQWN